MGIEECHIFVLMVTLLCSVVTGRCSVIRRGCFSGLEGWALETITFNGGSQSIFISILSGFWICGSVVCLSLVLRVRVLCVVVTDKCAVDHGGSFVA